MRRRLASIEPITTLHPGKGLAATLRIDRNRPVRALVRLGIRGVGIVGADLAVGSIAIDHRIHVAGGDAEEQVGLAEFPKFVRRIPVRLADDADAEALRLQQAPDQRHAETGMVDVGVASHQNDVAGIPAKRIHFRTRHRQERRRAETLRPELAMAEQRPGDLLKRIHGVFYLSRQPHHAWHNRQRLQRRRRFRPRLSGAPDSDPF